MNNYVFKALCEWDSSLLKEELSKINDVSFISEPLEQEFRIGELRTGDVKALSEALRDNVTLKRLNLSKNVLHNKAARYIVDLLEHNSCLEDLVIEGVIRDPESIQEIFLGIKNNSSLHSLSIGRSLISQDVCKECKLERKYCGGCDDNDVNNYEPYCDYKSAQAIHDGLVNNSPLRFLDLSNCDFSDDFRKQELEIIFSALAQDKSKLEVLKFDGNLVHESIDTLSDSMRTNHHLKRLILKGNTISDDDVDSISQIITNNTTLEWLDIRSNYITDRGIQVIAEALRYNKRKIYLLLERNEITEEGIRTLKDSMAVNYNFSCDIIRS